MNNYMEEALKEANKALNINEVPVGAVIVYNDQIIGRGFNMREKNNDITAHAEIIAIKQASQKLGTWKLDLCQIYVSIDPCLMCYDAIRQSRIKKIYYSADQQISKKKSFQAYIHMDDQVEVIGGLLADESEKLMKDFFYKLRSKNVRH